MESGAAVTGEKTGAMTAGTVGSDQPDGVDVGAGEDDAGADDPGDPDDDAAAGRFTRSRYSGISSLRSPVRPVGARASGFPVNSGSIASSPVAWPTNCRLWN